MPEPKTLPQEPQEEPQPSVEKYVPPHKRAKKGEKAKGSVPESRTANPEPEEPERATASGKYVPPHRREQQGGSAPSSARAPAAYGVTKASRSVLLGEMLNARVARRDALTKSLDDLAEDDPSREAIQTELKELEIVLSNLKDEQKATRRGERENYSSRQERDKAEMGGRLAYLKEKSRRRASKHRLGTQEKRTRENLGAQLTWALRFNQPGSGKKTQVFPLAEGALKDEVAAAPLSRKVGKEIAARRPPRRAA